MSTGKQVRMRRVLGGNGKTLMVAMDQAAVGGPIGRLVEPQAAVREVVEGLPDSLILTRGMLRHGWQSIPGHIGLVMRVSGGFTILEGAREFRDRIITRVEDALRWGVDGIAATVKFGHELEGEFIQAVSAVADTCDRWGVPLVVEAMVALRGSAGLSEVEALAVAARAAAEMGADVVVMKYPVKGGNLVDAVRGCPVPVVVSMGDVQDEWEALEKVSRAVRDGAAGVVVGEIAFRSENPADFLRAVRGSLEG